MTIAIAFVIMVKLDSFGWGDRIIFVMIYIFLFRDLRFICTIFIDNFYYFCSTIFSPDRKEMMMLAIIFSSDVENLKYIWQYTSSIISKKNSDISARGCGLSARLKSQPQGGTSDVFWNIPAKNQLFHQTKKHPDLQRVANQTTKKGHNLQLLLRICPL